MSAIKKQNKNLIILLFLLLIFFSCSKKKDSVSKTAANNEITFIGLSIVGGKDGNYRIIKITKDSVKLEKGSTLRQNHKQWASKISIEDWKNLISPFDIHTLDLITSSESIQAQGETDETFQIKTLEKSHVYVNSYNDSIHYKQFENFKSQLNKILPKEYR